LNAREQVGLGIYPSLTGYQIYACLEKLGYALERGKHGQPEIRGYTNEYLETSRPRRE
jgi:hypothetical protein